MANRVSLVQGTLNSTTERKDGPSTCISGLVTSLTRKNALKRMLPWETLTSEGDKHWVPRGPRVGATGRQLQHALAHRIRAALSARGTHFGAPLCARCSTLGPCSCQSASSARPSQSSTNRSRGSGLRRHSGSEQQGLGGLAQQRLTRTCVSLAAGARSAAGWIRR